MTTKILPAFEGQVVNSHSLTVRLDQAPMTYLGIMVLSSKLMNKVIVETLDTVNEGLQYVARMASEVDVEEDKTRQLVLDEEVLH